MIKTIRKMGNSQGLIFDQALCELTGLKVGDEVNVVVHDGGTVTLTPMRSVLPVDEARASAKDLIRRNHALFKRLA